MMTYIVLLLIYFAREAFSAASCGASQNFDNGIKFPKESKLLSLDFFETNITNTDLGQLYVLYPENNPYEPDFNFHCTLTKTDENIFLRSCTGLTTSCNQYYTTLTVASTNNTALFTQSSGSGSETEAYWSSCPDQYVWNILCTNYNDQGTCAPSETKLGLFLRDSAAIGEAPLNDIIDDLLKVTKVKFGVIDGMVWYFTRLESNACVL